MRKKVKKSKAAMNKGRVFRLVKGLVVSWEDENPLSESSLIIPGTVTHRKPALRLGADKIFQDFKDYLTFRTALLWRIEITPVFLYPNGFEQGEGYEVLAHCILDDVNDRCLEVIKMASLAGAKEHYKTTRFVVECLGNRQPQECDFEFEEKVAI